MDFSKSMAVAASGMRAQTERMKIISENIANANSTSPTKGGDPYRRQIATISSSFDRELETKTPPEFGPADRAELHEKLMDVAERMLTEARTTRLH